MYLQINPDPGNPFHSAVSRFIKDRFLAVNGVKAAELTGAWGTREAFVAVVTTNMLMVFPPFKTWLCPFLAARETNNTRRPPVVCAQSATEAVSLTYVLYNTKSQGASPLINLSFSESEERTMNQVKVQSMLTNTTSG